MGQWPLKCSCGLHTYEDGTTRSEFGHELGDWISVQIDRLLRILRLRKPTHCGCHKRQQWLNRAGRRVRAKVISVATFLHPQ